MNANNVQFTVATMKIGTESVIVDVIPKIEYAVLPKAEPQIIDDEIVPEQFIPTSSLYLEDYVRPQELLVCRACLLSECRLYSMRGHNLEEIYQHLTNAPSGPKDNIPLLLCAKCACFLEKCLQFRQKTNIAQEMLNSLVFPVTYKQIKEAYDKVNIKFSPFTVRQMPPDHYDYCISEDFTDATTKAGTLIIKAEIKSDDDERNDKIPPVEGDDETDDDEPLANVSKCLKVQENEKEPKLKQKNPKAKSDVSENKKKARYQGRVKYKKHNISNVFKKHKSTLEEQLVELQERKEKYKYYKYKCHICFSAYHEEDRYKLHMARHAEAFGKYVCGVCALRYKTRAGLLAHIRAHSVRYCCVLCSFKTTVRKAEKGCSKNTEPKKPNVKNVRVVCEICGKSMQTGYLKGHMEEHEGKSFQCESCGKVFNNSIKYQKHVADYHSGHNHDCPHCGKHNNSKRAKKRHINVTHKTETFDCKLCSKTFKSGDYLKRHEEYVHYKTKTYKRIFVDPSKRKKKKAVVRERPEPDPAKPFVCEHCYKGFKNRAYLQQHLNFVHYKKPRNRYWKTKSKTKETTPKDNNAEKGRGSSSRHT